MCFSICDKDRKKSSVFRNPSAKSLSAPIPAAHRPARARAAGGARFHAAVVPVVFLDDPRGVGRGSALRGELFAPKGFSLRRPADPL